MAGDDQLREHLERDREVRRFRALYDRVLEALQRHDPIGVAADRPDEYKPEAGTILPRLAEAASADELGRVVHEEVTRWRGAEAAGPLERYGPLAEELWRDVARARS